MQKIYDIIIAGAGFAGLACAKYAAQQGLRVAVLDRKEDLTHSMHTTGIFVQEAFNEFPLPAHLVKPIASVRLFAPSLQYIDLARPDYAFYATDTPGVMEHLALEARNAGADIFLNTPFLSGTEHPDGTVHVNNGVLIGKFLVGCDGTRSRVAEIFNLSQNKHMLIGVEAEFEGIKDIEDRLYCFIDRAVAPGYIGWVLPGVKVVQIGLATTAPVKPDIDLMLAKIRHLFDFSQSRMVGRRGGLIPAGGTLRNVGTERVMLVGDAAGMVSPLTAGGIHTAMHYGTRAAKLIVDHIKENKSAPAKTLISEYPRFRVKSLLRRAMDIFPPDWVFNVLFSFPRFRKTAERIFFYKRIL